MQLYETYEYTDEVKFEIGRRIQEVRLKKGMDSVVLADYIGIGRNQLSRKIPSKTTNRRRNNSYSKTNNC